MLRQSLIDHRWNGPQHLMLIRAISSDRVANWPGRVRSSRPPYILLQVVRLRILNMYFDSSGPYSTRFARHSAPLDLASAATRSMYLGRQREWLPFLIRHMSLFLHCVALHRTK